MKQLLFSVALFLSGIMLHAQDDSLNDVRIVAQDEYIAGEVMTVSGYYAPLDRNASAAAQHTWSVTPCDQDGNVTGDPVYVQQFQGAPVENFDVPGSPDFPEGNYKIRLEVMNLNDVVYSTSRITTVMLAHCAGATTYFSLPPGENAPGTGTLYLVPGSYIYTISTSGNANLISNLSVAINYTAVAPSAHFAIVSNNTPFDFHILLSPTAPLCDAEGVTLTFTNLGSGVQCTFYFYVICEYPWKQTIAYMPSGSCAGVYYKSDDNLMKRMYLANNVWNYEVVTPWGGWNGIGVDGWLCPDLPNNKIYFKGTDNKLYNMMLYSAGGPLTGAIMGAISNQANVKSDLHYRNNDCVYIGTDDLIHHVYWANNTWNYQAIVPLGGWGNVTAAGGLALSTSSSNNIFFRSSTGAIYNLYQSGSSWNMQQITVSNTTIASNGDMVFDDSQFKLYYRGTDNNVHNVSWTLATGWVYDAMVPVNGTVPVGNSLTKNPGEDRVFFRGGADYRGYAIYKLNGQWRIDWLTSSYTNALGDMTAIGYNQVLFVSRSKEIAAFWFTGSYIWSVGPLVSSPKNAIGCSTYYLRSAEAPTAEIAPAENDGLFIFPNPADGPFQLRFALPVENAVGELYNVLGEKVDAFTFSGTDYTYAPSEKLRSGVYFVRVTTGGQTFSKQIVIQ